MIPRHGKPADFELLELVMLILGISSILRENILNHDTNKSESQF